MTQFEEMVAQAGACREEDPDKAFELCTKVVEFEPDNYKALYVIANVLRDTGRLSQASQVARRVVEIKPNAHYGWEILSIICTEQHRYDESIRFAEKALQLKLATKPLPDAQKQTEELARTYADASFAHTSANNWAKGREHARKSLEILPGNKDATFHLANCDLAEQRWIEGWKGFKVSEGTKWRKQYTYGDTKEWRGESDAVVMVTGEQGLGDEIMAASVIPDAAKQAQKFIFDCDPRCGTLFQRSFPGAIVTPTRHAKQVALPVAPTHHKSLFGLLSLFRMSNTTFPRQSYLVPNAEYVRMFKALFTAMGHKRMVGIAWSGGFPRTGLAERTAGISAFMPLFAQEPDAAYVSLQYKDDAAEVVALEQNTGFKVLRFPWITAGQDMDVLAAFIAALDEVIGVATAALHMSSALGVPTTWLCNRGLNWVFAPDELLWYPKSAKIWRKDRGESWRDCVAAFVWHRQSKDESRILRQACAASG